MSDEERRRQEEERRRFERIRSLDTGEQETNTGRRRHAAGAQPFNDPLDPFSRIAPRPQTGSTLLDTGVEQTNTGRRRHPAGAQPFNDPLDPFSRSAPRPQTGSTLLDMGIQQTDTGRRRHAAGAQPFNDPLDPFSRSSPRPQTGSTLLDTGVQQTNTGRRRHAAGAQPFNDPLDPFSRGAPRPQTGSYTDMYLSQEFGQSMNLGTQPYQQGSRSVQQPHRTHSASSATGMWGSSSIPYSGSQRTQSASSVPSDLSGHITGQQASSQSVRPKQSSTGIPEFARQQPIPEPKLVHRYRDPVTGLPSVDRLRKPASTPRPWGEGPASSQQMGSYLANLSRDNIRSGVLAQDRKKSRRQKDALLSRGFQRVEDDSIFESNPAQRYAPQSTPSVMSQRRRFVPQTERDMIASRDFRFNRPQREISKPRHPQTQADITIAPVGRQQYGSLRRAYSMPDLSDPNLQADINEPSRIAQFVEQYADLPTADRESYRRFHDQVSLAENPQARDRMVPRPTIGNIRNSDRRRLKEIAHYRAQMMQYRIGDVSAEKLRQARRNFVRDGSYQETALPTKTEKDRALAEWLAQGVQQSIPEEDEEEM